MLHPDLGRALATAHIEDLHRAAARRRAIRLARRAAHEPAEDWDALSPQRDPLSAMDLPREEATVEVMP